jgi:hypothetical protein
VNTYVRRIADGAEGATEGHLLSMNSSRAATTAARSAAMDQNTLSVDQLLTAARVFAGSQAPSSWIT